MAQILVRNLRIVVFDTAAAESAGRMASRQRAAGRVLDVRDLLIAGVAETSRATLATRNQRHFEGLGAKLVNPWTARAGSPSG